MIKRMKNFFEKYIYILSDSKIAILAYLAAVIIRLIINIPFAFPITTGDEYLMLAFPAKLAGVDWDNLLSSFYRYYGIGLTIFAYPLFMLRLPMIVIYRFLLVLEVLIGTLPVIIAYIILRIFLMSNKRTSLWLAFCSGFITPISYTYIYNENLYATWVWGAILIILCLAKNRKLKYQILLSFLFVVDFGMALLVHQRAITIILCYFGLYIIVLLLYKKTLGSAVIVCGGSYLLYKLDLLFIDYQYRYIFPDSSAAVTEVGNVSVNIDSSTPIFSASYILNGLRVVIGQFSTINLLFFGLGFLAIWCIVVYLRENNQKDQSYVFLLMIFCSLCIIVTIGGQYNGWYHGFIEALAQKDYSADGMRLLLYTRYIHPYFSPLFICAIGIIEESNFINEKRIIKYILGMTFVYFVWFKSVVVYFLNESSYISSALSSIISFYSLRSADTTEIQLHQLLFVLIVVLFIVLLVLNAKRVKGSFVVWVCLAFLFYRFMQDPYGGIIRYQTHYSKIDKMVEFATITKESLNDIDFYSPNKTLKSTDQRLAQILQVNVYWHPFVFTYPGADAEQAICFDFDDGYLNEMKSRGYESLVLSQDQYIYYKGHYATEVMDEVKNTLIQNAD